MHNIHLLFTLLIIHCTIQAKNDDIIPLSIDGFNTILLNQQYFYKSQNIYSSFSGNPGINYPFNLFSEDIVSLFTPARSYNITRNNDSIYHIEGTAIIGSEIGDGLLNQFTNNTPGQNRDHYSNTCLAFRPAKLPLALYGSYRYVDTYSDNFDSQRTTFIGQKRVKMSYEEIGLAEEYSGGLSIGTSAFSFIFKALNYKHWGVTPVFFSPLYFSGYSLHPEFFLSLPASSIYFDFLFDHHRDYYNHITYQKYLDRTWNLRFEKHINKGITGQFSLYNNTKNSPSIRFNALITDSIPHFAICSLSADIYQNFKTGGGLTINYIRIPELCINLNANWNFNPAIRNYSFTQLRTPDDSIIDTIDYISKSYKQLTVHSSIYYRDTLFFPFTASLWTQYITPPVYEVVDYSKKRISMRQETFKDKFSFNIGGKTSYNLSYKNFSVNLWGNFTVNPFKITLPYFIPANGGIDIGCSRCNSDSFYLIATIEARSQLKMYYKTINQNESSELLCYDSPARYSLSVKCNMPFLVPVLRKFMVTSFNFEAGPIHLFPNKTRINDHPFGNFRGPVISAGIKGYSR